MGLYEKVDQLCKSKGIEKSNLGEVLGIKLTKGTVSKWQKGAMPRASTLKAMADYFGVTVEYLTNDDAVSVQTVQDNHGIIGSTHAPVTIINGSERKLSEQEIALLNLFEKLSVVDQSKLIVFAEELSAK
ncbi:MAG: helix-turn-helix transcriptional regulator [Clostridia bacterium]|nr:helix-turn-helix transcriptional regulator [Clostridia bacterium]